MTTIASVVASKKTHTDPRDREHLLSHVLKKPREWVIAHPGAPVRPATAARYRRLLRRLEHGEPLAHLLGEAWFYGRPFTVNGHVLIPRPETELLVELAIRRIKNNESRIMEFQIPDSPPKADPPREDKFQILDIGTGSGCIAVTLAAELPNVRIIAIDTSPAALRIARANARRHDVSSQITCTRGNLLEPLLSTHQAPPFQIPDSRFQILITANLPYLTTAEWRALPRSLRSYEPRQAFDGGPDGLKHFRALFGQLKKLSTLNSQLSTLLEVDPRRKRALSALIRKTLPGWRASWHRDLAGRWRIVELQGPTV